VSSGSKHSLYNIFLALLDQGDEVIIPVPYWTSYPEQVKLAGGVPVFADTDDNFHIDVRGIEKAITKRTKAIVINSPNNPSGMMFDKNSLKALAAIAKEHNIFLVSDEIYEHFVYDNNRHASIAKFAKENTILVNGVSKAYAMTGWRIGYCAADEKIIRAVSDIQGQTTSNPSSISQMAALEALSRRPSKDMVNEFDKRRKYAVKRLADMGFKFKVPEGAFYVFPEVPTNSVKFSGLLLDKARVAVVPGKDFGSDKHVRISYATSMKNIEEGMDRIEKVLKKI
jgi:aspartate aminotransferase